MSEFKGGECLFVQQALPYQAGDAFRHGVGAAQILRQAQRNEQRGGFVRQVGVGVHHHRDTRVIAVFIAEYLGLRGKIKARGSVRRGRAGAQARGEDERKERPGMFPDEIRPAEVRHDWTP